MSMLKGMGITLYIVPMLFQIEGVFQVICLGHK